LRLPREYQVGGTLAEQKVTLALPEETSRAALLECMADLLQCEWIQQKATPGSVVLTRTAAAAAAVRRREQDRRELGDRVRAEQRRLMLDAFRRTRRALNDPVSEILPGHWGRRGVAPGSEALVPFLDELSPAQWDQLLRDYDFEPGVPLGLGARHAFDPILLWSWRDLAEAQQARLRRHLTGTESADVEKVCVYLANRGGVELTMGVFTDRWTEQPLVYAVEGPGVRLLRGLDQTPVLPGDAAFSAGLPAGLARRAQEIVRWPAGELDYAEACLNLSRTLRAAVVADYYTLETRLRPAGPVRLEEVFTTLHRAFGCRFAWDRGILMIRRGDWPDMDRREISEPILEVCVAQKKPSRGWRTLETRTLAWLAARLTEPQLACLREYAWMDDRNIQFAGEARILREDQALLSLIGALGASRERQFFREGVPWAVLRSIAPRPFHDVIRRRAPWIPSARGVEAGVLRMEPHPGGTLVGTVDGVQPARAVFEYRQAGRTRRRLQETWVPWPGRLASGANSARLPARSVLRRTGRE